MPKLTPLSRKVFIKKLHAFGYDQIVQGGDHQYLIAQGAKVKMPNVHAQKDIPVFIIKLVINRLAIDRDDWINA